VARGTPGFSGADLANLVNEAALIAARAGRTGIGLGDLDEARDKVLMGVERPLARDDRGRAPHDGVSRAGTPWLRRCCRAPTRFTR
jgi:SpoVK/Ycf46/Vps4 family AAA+-type ATPase